MTLNKPNIDPETGTAFGVIGAHVLDGDLVDQLIYGSQITNHTYLLARANALLKARAAALFAGKPWDEEAEDAADNEFSDGYQRDEDLITGTWDGVEYATGWLGGALHFFITKSPHTKHCAHCSPCIPGAGDLHSEGDVLTYDVAPAWRA